MATGNHSKKILIVDDDEINCTMLQNRLSVDRYESSIAHNGEQALELLNTNPKTYSVVLLDKYMPGIDGFEVLEKIKQHPVLKKIPVILQTGANEANLIMEGLRLGAFHFLAKPYDMGILSTLVKTAIGDLEHYESMEQNIKQKEMAVKKLQQARFKFKTITEARSITALLASSCPYPSKVLVGLVELMINAVEHGNLEINYRQKSDLIAIDGLQREIEKRLQKPPYADREVEVEFNHLGDNITFDIKDQGKGFDWQSYLEIDTERMVDTHGRGIAVAKNFTFSDIEFFGTGNHVKATIDLRRLS